jgi:hypothetical protein
MMRAVLAEIGTYATGYEVEIEIDAEALAKAQ